MTSTPNIEAVDFIDWLFRKPLLVRIGTPSAEKLLAAARLLHWLSVLRIGEEVSGGAASLAQTLGWMGVVTWKGALASQALCRSVLNSLAPKLRGSQSIDSVLDFLTRMPASEFEKMNARVRLHGRLREWHSGGRSRLATRSEKPPDDDLSERISLAVHVLEEAGCKSALVTVARRLNVVKVKGENWTPQRVNGRTSTAPKARYTWPDNDSIFDFWVERFVTPNFDKIPRTQPFRFIHTEKQAPRMRQHLRASRPKPSGKPELNAKTCDKPTR